VCRGYHDDQNPPGQLWERVAESAEEASDVSL
jgi:hypothetical protein